MVKGIFVDNITNIADLKGVQADICIRQGHVSTGTRTEAENFEPDPTMRGTMTNGTDACVGTLSRLSLFRDNVLSPILMASPTRCWLFGIALVCFIGFLFFLFISKSWGVFHLPIHPIFAPYPYSVVIVIILFLIALYCFIKSLKIPWRTFIPHSYGEVLKELNQSVFCFSIGSLESLLFRVDNLKDHSTRLATKWRDARDPLSNYLRGQFSLDTQQLLGNYGGSGPPSEALQRALVDELNRLLQGNCLYDQLRAFGVTLARETQRLLQRNPQGVALISLNRWILEDAYPDEITKRPRDFRDISAGGSFFCASAIGVLKKWDIPGRDYLIPPWGWALVKEEEKYVISAGIDAIRDFTRVGDWDKKLKAVLDARLGGREIKVVMCSLEDWETVKNEWRKLIGSELADKKDWLSGCRYAKDLGITFLACPNVSALIKYLSPHRLRWLVPRFLAVIGLVFVLLSGTYPPKPVFLPPDFSPHVEIYSPSTPNAPPIIKMSHGDELTLFIKVTEPLSQYPFKVHVKADSESLWTEFPWIVVPILKNEVELGIINSKTYSEAEKVNFKMPSVPWQALTVTIRVYDHYGQYSEKKYQFIGK